MYVYIHIHIPDRHMDPEDSYALYYQCHRDKNAADEREDLKTDLLSWDPIPMMTL